MINSNRIIKQFGTWAVTSYGIEHIGHQNYEIIKSRIHEENSGLTWKDQLSDKRWSIKADFDAAHDYAMKLWPKKI